MNHNQLLKNIKVGTLTNGSFPAFADYLIRTGKEEGCNEKMQHCPMDEHWQPFYAR